MDDVNKNKKQIEAEVEKERDKEVQKRIEKWRQSSEYERLGPKIREKIESQML